MTAEIFRYCERGQDPSFWAEPLNALSNAAFIIAGVAALAAWIKHPAARRDLIDLALIALVIVIGIGSFLFHTFATRWAAIADTAPIGIFMLAYLGYAVARFARQPPWIVVACLVAFIGTLAIVGGVRCGAGPCLNGSAGYLPAFGALVVTGGLLGLQRHPAGRLLMVASGVFLVSLVFRSVDRAVCPWTLFASSRPLGTHFLWHLLNATVLYLLLRAALLYGARAPQKLTRPVV